MHGIAITAKGGRISIDRTVLAHRTRIEINALRIALVRSSNVNLPARGRDLDSPYNRAASIPFLLFSSES
jgi:hypothetical protein